MYKIELNKIYLVPTAGVDAIFLGSISEFDLYVQNQVLFKIYLMN